MDEATFDPQVLAARVREAVEQDPAKIEEGRDTFLETIFDWSDYYNENFAEDPSSEAARKHTQALLDLWLAYAELEISLRQYKKATDIFEKAAGDPIVGRTVRIYTAGAEYCVSRGRLAAAQKALLTGLCAGLERQADNDLLWGELLALIRQVNQNSALSLQQLHAMVVKEVTDPAQLAPLPAGTVVTETMPADRWVEAAESKEEDEQEGVFLDELEAVAGMTPDQVVRSFRLRPPMLFSAPHREPMASGTGNLDAAEREALETFLQTSLSGLSQASGRAAEVLAAVEGLYSVQALKERHFEAWIAQLNTLHQNQEADFNRKSGSEAERKKLLSRLAVQREVLQAVINKTLFALLLEQQRVLSELRFPHFSAVFADTLQAAPRTLAAAGAGAQAFFDAPTANELGRQQRLVCAVLSTRLAKCSAVPKLERAVSGESDGMGDDYYSAEAKKQRKRRRSVHTTGGPSHYGPGR